MTGRDILSIRMNYGVGQKIKVPKRASSDTCEMVEVEIVGIYPHILTVTNGRYNWSITWIDMLRWGLQRR